MTTKEKNGDTRILEDGQGRESITFLTAIPVFLEWDTLVFLGFALISNAVMSNQPRS